MDLLREPPAVNFDCVVSSHALDSIDQIRQPSLCHDVHESREHEQDRECEGTNPGAARLAVLNKPTTKRKLVLQPPPAIERLRKRARSLRERRERASLLDPEALHFFSRHYRPAAIGLVGTDDPVGRAIREAQKRITGDGRASLWSHCFLFGDVRFDRRGPNGALGRSVYILESDLHAGRGAPQIRNGAQENWVGKWCVGRVEHAAVLHFPTTARQRRLIVATALQLAGEQLLYPVVDLLGT